VRAFNWRIHEGHLKSKATGRSSGILAWDQAIVV